MEIKYLLLALPLVLVGCSQPSPKFHYNDCLRLEDKFYGTTYGRTTEYRSFSQSYTILRKIGDTQKEWIVSENLLTKVDDGFCSDIK